MAYYYRIPQTADKATTSGQMQRRVFSWCKPSFLEPVQYLFSHVFSENSSITASEILVIRQYVCEFFLCNRQNYVPQGVRIASDNLSRNEKHRPNRQVRRTSFGRSKSAHKKILNRLSGLFFFMNFYSFQSYCIISFAYCQ